jgi:hypothetical protein
MYTLVSRAFREGNLHHTEETWDLQFSGPSAACSILPVSGDAPHRLEIMTDAVGLDRLS